MSTHIELGRAKEQQLAATREALAQAMYDGDWDYATPVTKEKVFLRADAILSSGILRDADEVRREARDQGQGEGYLAMKAEYERHHCLPTEARLAIFRHIDLKAAIAALCDEFDLMDRDCGPELIGRLRALVADDGFALREVKAQVWDEGYERAKGDHCDYYPSHDSCTEDSHNPYRNTAGSDGDEQ